MFDTETLGNMKRCCTCKQTLLVIAFSNNKSTKDGKHHQCKTCKATSRLRYQHRVRDGAIMTPRDCEQLAPYMIKSMHESAARRGLVVSPTITPAFIVDLMQKQRHICPILDIRYQHTPIAFPGHFSPFLPSIDRINSSDNYFPGHIRIVCSWVNRAIGDSGLEHFDHCVRLRIKALQKATKKKAPRKTQRPTNIIDLEEFIAAKVSRGSATLQ